MRRLVTVVFLAVVLVIGAAAPVRSGDDAGANRLLVEAVTLVEQAEAADAPGDRAELYRRALGVLDKIIADHPGSDLAVKLATGQPIGTLERAEVERQWRFSTLDQCVVEWDRLCLLDLTLEITLGITKEPNRSSIRSMIAQGQAEVGAFTAANKTANSVEDLSFRVWALTSVAKPMAAAGACIEAKELLDEAVALAASFDDSYERAWAYGVAGASQADAGDEAGAHHSIQQALEAFTEVVDPLERVLALISIAEAQAKANNVSESRRLLRSASEIVPAIDSRLGRVEVLTSIAWIEAQAGNRVDALRNLVEATREAHSVRPRYFRDKALSLVAHANGISGEYDAAFGLIEDITSPYWLAWALSMVAAAQAKIGDHAAARQTVDLALQAVKDLKNSTRIAYVLTNLTYAINQGSSNLKTGPNCEY